MRKHIRKVKIVDTCEENKIHPAMFSNWLKMVLEAGREALVGPNKKEQKEEFEIIDQIFLNLINY